VRESALLNTPRSPSKPDTGPRAAGPAQPASQPALTAITAALFAALFVALALAGARAWDVSGRQVSDVPLYRTYGERVAEGQVPYRDFRFEYPPGALPLLVLPALVTGTPEAYEWTLALLLALCGAAAVLLTWRTLQALGRPARTQALALGALALSPLVLGAVLLTRFDLLPALAVAAATLALVTGRDRLGGALLGAGIAIKLYPLVLLPLAVAWTWRRRGRRCALESLGLATAVVVLAYLPFLVLAPDGVASSIARQLGRPLQIETLGAGVLLVLHQVADTGFAWSSSHGSQNVDGGAAAVLAMVTSLVQVGALAAAWAWFARGPAEPERLVQFLALALAVFVAFGKVLSPQFLVWLLFAVPLVGGAAGLRAGVLYAAACAATALWFPARYWELVRESDPLASWLVLARGLLLVGLVLALAVGLRATGRAPARSRSPGPSPGRT
jgi:hypothetical protein